MNPLTDMAADADVWGAWGVAEIMKLNSHNRATAIEAVYRQLSTHGRIDMLAHLIDAMKRRGEDTTAYRARQAALLAKVDTLGDIPAVPPEHDEHAARKAELKHGHDTMAALAADRSRA